MSDNPSLGEQFLNDIRPEEFAARAERRFEGAVVEKILSYYDAFTAMKFELIRKMKREQTGPFLTFDAFREEFPGRFPLYLFVRKLPKIAADMPLHYLIDRFETRQIFQAMTDAAEDAPAKLDCQGLGLVFFWPFLKDKASKTKEGGALVLHNWHISDDIPGLQINYLSPEAGLWHLDPLGRILAQCQRTGVFAS